MYYGLVLKGTKELLGFEVRNGCDEGEITYGPVYSLSKESHHPFWLVGNYDLALNVTKQKYDRRKAWMFDSYENPDIGKFKGEDLEVVQVTMQVK